MPFSLAPLAFLFATQHLRPLDLIIIAAYLVAITVFGLRFSKSSRSTDRSLRGYFLAGNTVPWWAIALSVVSAETSTLTIVSIPGVAFAGNFGFLQVVLGYLVGRVVVALLFLPRYFAGEMLTAYQLIDQRFGPVLHKVTAALFLLTRAAAEGVRVFAVSIVVTIALGTGDVLSIAIISSLTLLYTFEGGLAAVIWTDVVQMGIYVAGTLVALISLGHHVPGGWHAIAHGAQAFGKFHTFTFALNLTSSYTFWAGLLGGTFLTMASHGTDQLMVQRLLAARNLREGQWALLSSGVVVFAQFAFFLLIGVGLWYFYSPSLNGATWASHPPPMFRTNDYIFPTFITQQLPSGIAGLLIAAILAAAMSNLSAALNSLSSTTVVDFYIRARPQASDRERSLVSRGSTALWAAVLFALAIVSLRQGGKGHVVEIGLSIASVAYGCLLGVFLLGTLTRFATEIGAILGMLTGFALNLWLWQGSFPKTIFHTASGPHCKDALRDCASVGLTIPHIAFTWYVLIGAAVTFAMGALASVLLRLRRPAQLASTASLTLLVLGMATFSACAAAQTTPVPPTTQTSPVKPRTSPRTPNPAQLPAKPVTVAPAAVADFSAIATLFSDAISRHQLPGAVVVVGHGGEVVFHHAFGERKLPGEPGPDGGPSPAEPMTEDTVFDMASLTKCIVTATAVMQLYEQGKLDIDAAVARYLPGFNPTHDPARAKVTVRLLLTHFSGEAPDINLKDAWGLASPDKPEGIRRALTTPLTGAPGTKFVYSDINFILLGDLVETLSGERLDDYARAHLFQPLGMSRTRYLPFDRACGDAEKRGSAIFLPAQLSSGGSETKPCEARSEVWSPEDWIPATAPTAHDDEGTPATNHDFNHLLRGTVHDPTTRRMGGVAGHAGLFSTAHDMTLFAQALLDRFDGRPSKFPLQRRTLVFMAQPQQPGHTPFQIGEHYRANAAALAGGQKSATGNPDLLDPNFPAIKDEPLRGFGWDIDTGYSKPRGRLPIGSFGHTGFTGTSLWLDPQSDTFVLLLSNAIHPKVGTAISNLRGEVASAAANALDLYSETMAFAPGTVEGVGQAVAATASADSQRTAGDAASVVQTGLDVLESTQFSALAGLAGSRSSLRLGLLTNQTGLDRQGRRTIDVLATDLPRGVPKAQVVTLFSPEHGILGRQDSEHLSAESDPATGLHVTSLYGAHESDRRPSHEQIKDLDAVIVDLQDAGVRCYTYETVLGYFLEAAAAERTDHQHDLAIVVLDRPNPLGGLQVAGPTSDPGSESYINYLPLPFQHGLTFGELAQYINATKHLNAHLLVVPMQGWTRKHQFPETGLRWTPPSPNLRTFAAARLYPATAMLELTNLSVGRGTPVAFEGFGVPHDPTGTSWLEPGEVVAALNQRNLPGLRFEQISLSVPEDANHYPGHGQTMAFIHIVLTSPDGSADFDGPRLGIEILTILHNLYPEQFALAKASRIIASKATMDALQRGATPEAISAGWAPALADFQERRSKVLLYR